MAALPARPGQPEQVTDLGTKRELAALFGRHRSARLLLGAVGAVAVLRLGLAATEIGRPGWSDLVVGAISLLLIGPVEWFAHQVLFHAPEASRRSRLLNTGASHRRHHADPTDLAWVLLHPRGARALMGAVTVLTLVWAVPIPLVLGDSPLGPYLTTLIIGWAAIAHYEWVHLMVHSRYRPTSRHYRRLARNHRLHHYRNEEHWFGVTTNLGDRLLGTLPPSAESVPMSDTARTL